VVARRSLASFYRPRWTAIRLTLDDPASGLAGRERLANRRLKDLQVWSRKAGLLTTCRCQLSAWVITGGP